jgi:hypothetical protein
MKQGIMPSIIDQQDLDTLLWIILSDNKQEDQSADGAIMGLL